MARWLFWVQHCDGPGCACAPAAGAFLKRGCFHLIIVSERRFLKGSVSQVAHPDVAKALHVHYGAHEVGPSGRGAGRAR
jgi:hypothetical protein